MVGQIEILKLDFRELTDFIVVNHSGKTNGFSNNVPLNSSKLNLNQKELLKFHELNTKIPYDLYLKSINSVENVFYCNENTLDKILNDRIIYCTSRYEAIAKWVQKNVFFYFFKNSFYSSKLNQ